MRLVKNGFAVKLLNTQNSYGKKKAELLKSCNVSILQKTQVL